MLCLICALFVGCYVEWCPVVIDFLHHDGSGDLLQCGGVPALPICCLSFKPSMFVCSIVVLYLLRSVVRTLFKHLFVWKHTPVYGWFHVRWYLSDVCRWPSSFDHSFMQKYHFVACLCKEIKWCFMNFILLILKRLVGASLSQEPNRYLWKQQTPFSEPC